MWVRNATGAEIDCMAAESKNRNEYFHSQGDQLKMRIGDSAEELLELLWIAEEEDAKSGLEP